MEQLKKFWAFALRNVSPMDEPQILILRFSKYCAVAVAFAALVPAVSPFFTTVV